MADADMPARGLDAGSRRASPVARKERITMSRRIVFGLAFAACAALVLSFIPVGQAARSTADALPQSEGQPLGGAACCACCTCGPECKCGPDCKCANCEFAEHCDKDKSGCDKDKSGCDKDKGGSGKDKGDKDKGGCGKDKGGKGGCGKG